MTRSKHIRNFKDTVMLIYCKRSTEGAKIEPNHELIPSTFRFPVTWKLNWDLFSSSLLFPFCCIPSFLLITWKTKSLQGSPHPIFIESGKNEETRSFLWKDGNIIICHIHTFKRSTWIKVINLTKKPYTRL